MIEQVMLEKYQGLVVSIVNKYWFPSIRLPQQDLIQEGNIGLLKAIRKFDPDRGNKFITYATWEVRAAITRALQDKAKLIKVPAWMQDRLREPIPKETRESDAAFLERTRHLNDFVTSHKTHDEEMDSNWLENMPSDTDTFKDISNRLLWEKLLAKITTLKIREREVLGFRFRITGGERLTFGEISEKLGMTSQRAHQIEKEALQKLKFAFAQDACCSRATA